MKGSEEWEWTGPAMTIEEIQEAIRLRTIVSLRAVRSTETTQPKGIILRCDKDGISVVEITRPAWGLKTGWWIEASPNEMFVEPQLAHVQYP
jgi:hypothetical protein